MIRTFFSYSYIKCERGVAAAHMIAMPGFDPRQNRKIFRTLIAPLISNGKPPGVSLPKELL